MQFPIDIIGLKLDFFISKNNEIRNRDSTREGDKLSIVACAVCAEISGQFWDLPGSVLRARMVYTKPLRIMAV